MSSAPAWRGELKHVELSGWGDPVRAYYYDRQSYRERTMILRYYDVRTSRLDPEGIAAVCVARLRNQDGSQPYRTPDGRAVSIDDVLDRWDPADVDLLTQALGILDAHEAPREKKADEMSPSTTS